MNCWGRGGKAGVGITRQRSVPLLRGPEDFYVSFCILGIFPVCTGKFVLPWNQATCKVNATDKVVYRPGVDAGVWVEEMMETLHGRIRGKKAFQKQESKHNSYPGLWRLCHWLPLIEFDPHLLF